MNHNVVTADGDNWRRQRTSITPAFKTDSYRQYYPTFVNMTKKLLAIFEAVSSKERNSTMFVCFVFACSCYCSFLLFVFYFLF